MTFALNQYSQNMKTKVSNIGLKRTWPSSLSVPLVCEDGKTRGSRACTIWPSTQRYRQNGEELRRHIVGELWGLLFIIIFWAYNWTTVERLSKIYHLFDLGHYEYFVKNCFQCKQLTKTTQGTTLKCFFHKRWSIVKV